MSGKPPTHPKLNTRKNKKNLSSGIFNATDTIVKFKRNADTIMAKVEKQDGSFKTIVLSTKEAIQSVLKAIERNRPVKFKVIQLNKSIVIKSYRITEEAAKQFMDLQA